jgi:hypothetical protein
MGSRVKTDIYTCVGVLLLVLAIGLYLVWVTYGFYPFVIGGIFVAIFTVWIVYNSRKEKHKPQASSEPTLSSFQSATPEERQKILEEKGFIKYTDENGNTKWRAPEQLAEWTKAEKVDVTFKNNSMEMVIEKEGPKIRCSYCGTVYDEKLDKCPNCGASRQGNEEVMQDPFPNKP